MRGFVWAASFAALTLAGCTKKPPAEEPAGATTKPAATAAADEQSAWPNDVPPLDPARVTWDEPRNTLILSQAQFINDKPGPARLVLLREYDGQWRRQIVEDPDSNVFHKTMILTLPGDASGAPGLLTIGAMKAALKYWKRTGDEWSASTLWQASFGGKFDRLRDVEIGDVTGDGQPDLVLATHDQGVVEVLKRAGESSQPLELDRKPDTFVHEIELGDLDGDGTLEIYATPSERNRFDGTDQPGHVVSYHFADGAFERVVVEEFPARHCKEILLTDLGDGLVLFGVVEAELGSGPKTNPDANLTVIKRYVYRDGAYQGDVVATLPDALCRFLNAGDVTGDGRPELVASTKNKGVYVIWPAAETPWKTRQIDADSGGFEHSTTMADLDGDGRQEIYVAADDQHRLRRYTWKDERWQRENLCAIDDNVITWCVTAGKL